MSAWSWLLIGLLFAGGISGGLWWISTSSMPKQKVLTAAEQAEKEKHIADDIEADPVNLEKATNPTDLPGKLQEKFDNSKLSEKHRAEMAEVLSPLPKVGPDAELVDTKRAPTSTDDFSNPASGWRVGTDANSVRSYTNGKLQSEFRADQGSAQIMAPKMAGNFAMQIEATPSTATPNFYYGVVLRVSAGKYITFLLGPQGIYAISKRENGQTATVVPPTKNAAIKTGMATNVIKVYAVDDYFVFEVNGTMVEVQTMAGFPAGALGVIVSRSPSEAINPTLVTFDNFKIWAVR